MSQLYTKLFKLQSTVGKISKDKTNPFFKSKYFDINDLIEHLTPHLQEIGLLLLQPIKEGNVYSLLIDPENGEREESYCEIPDISDPQKMGSAITYLRRYTLQSLLGMNSNDDDDGNKSSNQSNNEEPAKKWLNATNKDGSLNNVGEATAQKLAKHQTTWQKIESAVRVSKKDKEAVQNRAVNIMETPS